MTDKGKRVLSAVLLIAWMIVILLLSFQDKDQSENTSEPFALIVAAILDIPLDTLPAAQRALEMERCQQVARTMAHMAEYAVLSALSYWVCAQYLRQALLRSILCLLFVILFATFDELRQGSVDGRVADRIDVAWDTLGAGIGLCFCLILSWFTKRRGRHDAQPAHS